MLKFVLILLALYMRSSDSSELKAVNGTKDHRVDDVLKDRYHVVDTKLGWNEAKASCETWGAHLATLPAYADVERVKKIIKDDTFYWIGAQCPGCTAKDFEIKAEKWVWLTKEPLPIRFRYWRVLQNFQQPYGPGQFLAMKRKGSEVYLWNNVANLKYAYICQSP